MYLTPMSRYFLEPCFINSHTDGVDMDREAQMQ